MLKGFLMTESSPALIYFVSGMWCSSCAKNIRNAVLQIDGVQSAEINFASKLLTVHTTSPAQSFGIDNLIQKKIQEVGFGAKKQSKGWVLDFNKRLQEESQNKITWTRVSLVWFLAMWSSMTAFTGYVGGDLSESEKFQISLVSSVFGLPAIVLGILPYADAGLRSLRFSKILTLDLFIFIGGCSAIGVSILSLLSNSPLTYADSGAMIVGILLLSKKIEITAFSKLTSNILYQLHPQKSSMRILKKDSWLPIESSQVKKGDIIQIPRRETIPVDGLLVSDGGSINNHLINGEAESVDLKKGDHLFAGAIATSDLEMSVLAPQGERKIDDWAERALTSASKNSDYARIFQHIEGSLVIAAFLGAFCIAVIHYLRGAETRQIIESFFIGILIFCPCLFASIIPLSKQIVYLTLLETGVLIKNEDALLKLNNISRFYLDKTGTLETLEATYIPMNEEGKKALPYLKSLSEKSKHIILRNLSIPGDGTPLTYIVEYPGSGVFAKAVNGVEICIGRPQFVLKDKNDKAAYDQSLPLVSLNKEIVGQIFTKSKYALEAQNFLRQLLQDYPESKIDILSGDPTPNMGSKYERLDRRISYHGNLSPEEKAQQILLNSVFIGDGLNDTLALAKASVSFRLGHRIQGFAPVDFQLQTPNLNLILQTIEFAKKYRRVLFETAMAALVYNIIAISLASFGKFSPLGAVTCMAISFTLMLLSIQRLRVLPKIRR